jgi:surfeit locus 1 family protein
VATASGNSSPEVVRVSAGSLASDWYGGNPRIAFGRAPPSSINPFVSRRALAFVIFAIVVSAGCVRLGFWQLHRLSERRAQNAMLLDRMSSPPRPVRDVVRDSAAAGFRRATAEGTYDFENEFALAARTRQGSPGVNFVTPLRLAGTDSVVLVNRGWVYAPDAMTADFSRWTEPSAARVSGYLVAIEATARGRVSAATNRRVVRHLSMDSLSRRLPYPILPFILVATDTPSIAAAAASSASGAAATPARLARPTLDEGPHLGYAFQWFAFAFIGLVGSVVAVRADRRGTWRRGFRPIIRGTRP